MTEHTDACMHPESSEFPRPVKVADLGPDETVMEITAETDERAALAERLGLLSLDRLEATVRLDPKPMGAVALEARYRADVVQACVVTLAPVPVTLEGDFRRDYSPRANADDLPDEEELGEEEPPDPIIDGHIDIGEAVAEQLALDLDPFPRAADAAFAGFSTDPGGSAETARPNPFAVLAKLKDGKDGG